MTNECEILAGRLSEPMRQMLLRARPEHINEPPRCYGPANTRAALRERGLGHGDFCYLTPLGEQLQAYIKEGE